jgi:hypothetical protein
MYFFVRFTGIVTLVVGALLMLLGVGTTIYGFIQNAALVDLVNNYWLASSNARLVDARFYMAVLGLAFFLFGMLVSALGQLMLVFSDVATNTKETNMLLRGLRKSD